MSSKKKQTKKPTEKSIKSNDLELVENLQTIKSKQQKKDDNNDFKQENYYSVLMNFKENK